MCKQLPKDDIRLFVVPSVVCRTTNLNKKNQEQGLAFELVNYSNENNTIFNIG